GRAAQAGHVVAGGAVRGVADLQDEAAVAGELQDLTVIRAVPTKPDEAVWIDMDPVLALEPVVTRACAAPGPRHVARGVELDHRRRGSLLMMEHADGALDDPDVISGIGQNGSTRMRGGSVVTSAAVREALPSSQAASAARRIAPLISRRARPSSHETRRCPVRRGKTGNLVRARLYR